MIGEHRDVLTTTTRARQLLAAYFAAGVNGALPPALDAWVRHHETSALPGELPALRRPYVVEREDARLIVRLMGEHPRRLLLVSEERHAIDAVAFEARGLTRREAEVLRWIAGGKRDREIATILAISPRTVHHHVGRIYEKLGVETRGAAIALALRASADPPA